MHRKNIPSLTIVYDLYVICRNRQQVGQCITPLVSNPDPSCQQADIGMMDGTINSMISGLGNLCGARK